ncbi:unnamed protein product [Rhizophagus irregularis]|uniref:Uncharacterized protein n=1 Tax=Rhizophagus irregularis TaxID=588596 RepID=A0A916EHM6_9GLOM|nr:unnamed protein product [Rhizophagus irregularis]
MGCETDNYRCPTTQKQQIQSTDSKSHYLSVKDVYDKKELSTKLVVKDHNADMYRVFHSREEFWEFNDGVAEHLRSFSEVVYGDLPQFPRIHVEFGSLHRLPGTKIVSLLKQILDGMLDVFRSKYSGITNVPKLPNDFVVMDEYGQNRHGYWTNDFHIQATSFAFTDYREAKEFTRHVRSSLPVEVGRFISLQYNDPIQLVPILGSTCPKELLHKKISRFSQFLGTNVDIHKNELFVKNFRNWTALAIQKIITPHVHKVGNGFTIQQRTSLFAERENLPRRRCIRKESQNKSYRDNKQSDNDSETPRESTITTLSIKYCLPSISNECVVAINFLVLFLFIGNKIKQSNKSKMRSGGHVAKTPQKKKYDILKGQRHHQQHNGDAKTGKELVQRSSNCWKPWEVRDNPAIRPKGCFRKNGMTSWARMLVSMNVLVRSVICVHHVSKTRTYGPIPHMVIASTPSCRLYQFNPP